MGPDEEHLSDIADKPERESVEWSPNVSCKFPDRPSSSRSRRFDYRCTMTSRRRRRRRGEIMMSMPGRESLIKLSTFNHKTNSKNMIAIKIAEGEEDEPRPDR